MARLIDRATFALTTSLVSASPLDPKPRQWTGRRFDGEGQEADITSDLPGMGGEIRCVVVALEASGVGPPLAYS